MRRLRKKYSRSFHLSIDVDRGFSVSVRTRNANVRDAERLSLTVPVLDAYRVVVDVETMAAIETVATK